MIQRESTKNHYINNKSSKLIHLELNNPTNKDIIFIGSSKTFYHISTNIFKKHNLNIYNLGISGIKFQDFPTFIPTINEISPKKVFISLSVSRFYEPLKISKFPTKEELSYYYEIDKVKFLKALEKWFINLHTFLKTSKPIFYKISSFYKKFEPQPKIISVNKRSKKYYSDLVECNVFNIKNPHHGKTILKCKNGDGALLGHHSEKKKERVVLKKLNKQAVTYIHKLIDHINKSKTEVSLILEPRQEFKYEYKLSDIKKEFKNIEIIDLTNLKIDKSFTFDETHLNYQGRIFYSNYLIDKIKN